MCADCVMSHDVFILCQMRQPDVTWSVVSSYCLHNLHLLSPGREAEHSPPSSAEVKNAWSYISTPSIRFRGVVLS
jgi:hypothetical protein